MILEDLALNLGDGGALRIVDAAAPAVKLRLDQPLDEAGGKIFKIAARHMLRALTTDL